MTAIIVLLSFGVLLLALIFFGEGESIKVKDTFTPRYESDGPGCWIALLVLIGLALLIGIGLATS